MDDIFLGQGSGAGELAQRGPAPKEFRVYSSSGNCGAYRQEPGGEVCFVWNGVKVEWQEFLSRVHRMRDALTRIANMEHGLDPYQTALDALHESSEGRKERP